jgi:hypothetical protein
MGSVFPGERGGKTPMWNIVGLALALLISTAAYVRSRAHGGYYDAQVYGMVPSTHRRYGAAGLAFALFFIAAIATGARTAGIVALGILTLIALFYATSFLRGYADYDE